MCHALIGFSNEALTQSLTSSLFAFRLIFGRVRGPGPSPLNLLLGTSFVSDNLLIRLWLSEQLCPEENEGENTD